MKSDVTYSSVNCFQLLLIGCFGLLACLGAMPSFAGEIKVIELPVDDIYDVGTDQPVNHFHYAQQGQADATWQAWCDQAYGLEDLNLYNTCQSFAPSLISPDKFSTWVLRELYGFLESTLPFRQKKASLVPVSWGIYQGYVPSHLVEYQNRLEVELVPGMDRSLMHVNYYFF